MAVYMGYYHPNEEFARENGARSREAGSPSVNDTMRQKVIDLRDNLPASLNFIGSFAPFGGAAVPHRPGVWICETDDLEDLQFVTNWYMGFLEFEWVPARAVGTTAAATTEAVNR